MILVRTAWAGRAMETILAEAKIPYRFIGGSSIFAAGHVKDLLSLLRVAISHHDELALMRYFTLWPGIGSTKAAKAITTVATAEEADQILLSTFPALPHIVETIRKVRVHRDDPRRPSLPQKNA